MHVNDFAVHSFTRRSDVAEETLVENFVNWRHCCWETMTTWRRKLSTSVELGNGVKIGLGVRSDRRHVRSLLRELGAVEASPRHCVPLWRRMEIGVSVQRWVLNSP